MTLKEPRNPRIVERKAGWHVIQNVSATTTSDGFDAKVVTVLEVIVVPRVMTGVPQAPNLGPLFFEQFICRKA